jgi:hypothetical protein
VKKRIEILAQEARNELGEAAFQAQKKTEIDAWNSALAAVVETIETNVRDVELISVADVLGLVKGMMRGEGDEE